MRARAFTLIELMLVMALLLIVMAVAGPTLVSFFRGRTLDNEVRRFLSLTRYGQVRAASDGVPMVLWINIEEGSYGLHADTSYLEEDEKAVEYQVGKEIDMQVNESATKLSGVNSTISGLDSSYSSSIIYGNQNATNVPTIRFLPDGLVDQFSPESVGFREQPRQEQQESIEVWVGQSRNRLYYEVKTNVPPNQFTR